MRALFAAAFALASVDAATRVAVIEVGKSGVVRRTTSTNLETSAEGVASFFSALHGYGRKLQHAGMTVVPDIFAARPESGVLVGLSGVDLDNMPLLNALMTREGENGVVGHMEVPGHQSSAILSRVQDIEDVDATAVTHTCKKHANQKGISGIKVEVTSESASNVDAQLAAAIQDMTEDASRSERTVVLHIIVDEEDGAARRRNLARRLQEEEEGDQQDNNEAEGEQNQDNAEEEGGDNQQDGDANDGNNQQNNGYYGYGYYNAYGEWVTPYKTMFQIQYFNVVLWTAVGLFATLFFSIYLFIYMPLMADTLLFGEQARLPMDD